MTTRHFVHRLLHTHASESTTEHILRITLATLIVLSICSVVLETEESIYAGHESIFYWFEWIVVVIFSIEYLLRLWSCVEEPDYRRPIVGRMKYILSFMSFIDLLAILPFYVPQLIHPDFLYLRAIRLVRLLRVIKIGEYAKGFERLSTVLHKKRHDLQVSFIMITLLLIISSSTMYYLEHDAQPMAFSSIPKSLWWGVCTLTTIGYGEVAPVTFGGRIFTGLIMLLGIGSFALPSGIIVSGLFEEMDKKRLTHCPHCHEKLPKEI